MGKVLCCDLFGLPHPDDRVPVKVFDWRDSQHKLVYTQAGSVLDRLQRAHPNSLIEINNHEK